MFEDHKMINIKDQLKDKKRKKKSNPKNFMRMNM